MPYNYAKGRFSGRGRKSDKVRKKKKRKDKGVLEYVSVKNRKNVKALIRELGLVLIKAEIVEPER